MLAFMHHLHPASMIVVNVGQNNSEGLTLICFLPYALMPFEKILFSCSIIRCNRHHLLYEIKEAQFRKKTFEIESYF